MPDLIPTPVPETPAPPAETPPPVESKEPTPSPEEPWKGTKHRFKAAGEEHEVDYPELVRRASLGVGAEKRLAEANRKEKEIEAKLARLEKAESLEEVAEFFGGSDRAAHLAERYALANMLKEDEEKKLTPAERQARDEKKRADDLQAKLDEQKSGVEKAAKEAMSQQSLELTNREINAAIAEAEKAGLSPEDVPEYIERLVDGMVVHLEYLEECEEKGIPPTKSPLSPQDVLRKIQGRDTDRAGAWLKQLSPKDLKALLSAEQLEALRQSEIDAFVKPSTVNRAASASKQKQSETPIDPFAEKSKSKRRPNTSDWFAAMDERARTRR